MVVYLEPLYTAMIRVAHTAAVQSERMTSAVTYLESLVVAMR